MLIDSYSVWKIVKLRANLKPDEKIVSRGAILEVAKKDKWEIWRDRLLGMVKK